MPLRLVPALVLVAAVAAAEDTAPPSTPTTTTAFPASAPPREHQQSVEVATPDCRLRVLDLRLSFGGQRGPTRVHDDYEAGAGSMNPSGGYDYAVKRDHSGGGIFDLEFDMGRIHD